MKILFDKEDCGCESPATCTKVCHAALAESMLNSGCSELATVKSTDCESTVTFHKRGNSLARNFKRILDMMLLLCQQLSVRGYENAAVTLFEEEDTCASE
jgi:hypothetical protein